MIAQLDPHKLDTLVDEVYPRRPSPWRRSARGNLTRWHSGRHLTVFFWRGRWKWAVTDAETQEARYSPRTYPTEEAALDAVLAEARR